MSDAGALAGDPWGTERGVTRDARGVRGLAGGPGGDSHASCVLRLR